MADEIVDDGSGNVGEKKIVIDSPKGDKTFTQAQLDTILQERLGKQKTEVANMQNLLDDFKKNKSITEEQQTKLQDQIQHLQRSILSKEELSAKEKKELETSLTTKLAEVESDAKKWKGIYEDTSIERSIFDSAREDAFDPQQIITILKPHSKLVEDTVDGKPTGRHKTVISFLGQDKDGKPVSLELNPMETVAEMKKMTSKYGNLFKSGLKSGLGGTNDGGTGPAGLTEESVSGMDFETYKKNREKIKDLNG